MGDSETLLTEKPAILGGRPVRPEGPPEWPGADAAVAEALQRALRNGTWGKYHGPNSRALTEQLQRELQCEHVILCCSGTAAVELALRGLQVGAGDEVILGAYDFDGNFHNVLAVGARPVLVDVTASNACLDAEQLAGALGPATKAMIVSHLHGGVAPMRAVMELARERGVAVIEDACQMPGAVIDGRPAGLWGDVGVLSFGGSKLLSAGRGGAIFTHRADVAQRVRLYSQRGNDAYPLSELQAAVLVPQLQTLEANNRRRAENVALLCELVSRRAGLTPFHNPPSLEETRPAYYKLGFWYDAEAYEGLPRDLFAEAVRAEGVAIDPGLRALHRIHSRRRFRSFGDLPNATAADQCVVALHHPVLLGQQADLEQVAVALEKTWRYATMILEQKT